MGYMGILLIYPKPYCIYLWGTIREAEVEGLGNLGVETLDIWGVGNFRV